MGLISNTAIIVAVSTEGLLRVWVKLQAQISSTEFIHLDLGLFALKWADIETCAARYGVELDAKKYIALIAWFHVFSAQVKEYRGRNEMLWQLQPAIAALPVKVLKPIVEANGLEISDRAKSVDAAHTIADGAKRCSNNRVNPVHSI